MAHYVLPVPGDFYVFPAWQPHSVPPFRGVGERWSIAFNVVAVPQPPPRPAASPVAAQGAVQGNVSLSSTRPRPGIRVRREVLEPGPVEPLRDSLLDWWESNGRHHIPWKLRPDGSRPGPGEPLDPFGVWVAEVMLQQTQLAVVLPYWHRWMAAFPDLRSLAAASEHDVLMLWQGLGYYARARRLHAGAQRLVDAEPPVLSADRDPWPRTLEGWMALPGIGRSTAASILSSAFDLAQPILDGNVQRVLARLTAHPEPPKRQLPLFWRLSETVLDPQRPRAFNQALMDLGAGVCTPASPTAAPVPGTGAVLPTLPAIPAVSP